MLLTTHLAEAFLAQPLRTPLARTPPLARAKPPRAVAEFPTLVPHGRLELPPPPEPQSRAVIPEPGGKRFSLLSWNCLLPNGEDNWWCEKMYQAHVPEEARRWPHPPPPLSPPPTSPPPPPSQPPPSPPPPTPPPPTHTLNPNPNQVAAPQRADQRAVSHIVSE